ncbi:MAG: hypothetical protein ACTSPB_01455 [Candidatus Thorarchaeota archaeon]
MKNGKKKKQNTIGKKTGYLYEMKAKDWILTIILLAVVATLSYFWYLTFIYKPYPYSDPALLDTELVNNESLVTIKLINSLNERSEEGIYCRITNPVTDERWEYLSNKEGKVWVLVNNTENIRVYLSGEGFHSEIVTFVITMGDKQNVIHAVKPFNKIRFFVQVANSTHGIQDAEVYFDGSQIPVVTDQDGLAYIEIDEPRTMEYLIIPPEIYGEPYASSYTVDDYWVWDKVTVFFEKTPKYEPVYTYISLEGFGAPSG